MAVLDGKNYRVFVSDGGGTPVYTQVAGQTGLSIGGSTNMIDTSTKSTGAYTTQRPGRQDSTITVTGKLDLPDTEGLEAAFALSLSRAAEVYQIRKSPFDTGDVVWAASCYTGGFDRDFPDEESGTYSFTLTLAAVPTTDTLG